LFLILGWGYQPESVQAGIYLLLYTLLASLPLLVGILFVYNSLGSLCLFLLCGDGFLVGGLFYVCIFFAFLVKIPMFMVHLWLPRAHAEASVSGSIILVFPGQLSFQPRFMLSRRGKLVQQAHLRPKSPTNILPALFIHENTGHAEDYLLQ